jgi:hypothetical protein
MSEYKGWNDCDNMGRRIMAPRVITDKDHLIRTFMHYTDLEARKTLTVFGMEKEGLFYNYDDRLYASSGYPTLTWAKCLQRAAKKLGIKTSEQRTARMYELALCSFHNTDTVDIQHIVVGCNLSNGFSYLVFGYTYDDTNEQEAYRERRKASTA